MKTHRIETWANNDSTSSSLIDEESSFLRHEMLE